MPAGTYTITWSQDNRPNFATNPYYFQLNGVSQGAAFSAGGTSWTTTGASFTISSPGTYSVGFLGTVTSSDADVALDGIAVTGLVDGVNQLPTTTAVNIVSPSAAWDLTGGSQTIASLAGVAGTSLVNNVALTTAGSNASTVFAGTISGSGSLTAAGPGSALTLTGSNTYSGSTTVNAEKLVVNGSLVSPVTVNSGGTLAGFGYLSTVTVSRSGAISPGDPLDVMSISGNLDLATGAMMDYDLDTPLTSETIDCGRLALGSPLGFSNFHFDHTSNFGPGAYDLIQSTTTLPSGVLLSGDTSGSVDGMPAQLSVSGNELVLTVVPEPGTLVLLVSGAIGLAGYGWRRRRAARTSKPVTFDQQDAAAIPVLLLAATLAVLVAADLAWAGPIDFTAPMNISGDSNVATVGSMNYAYDWGTATTCNGVAFTSQTAYSGTIGNIVLSGLDSGVAGQSANAFGGGGMSAAYTDVIEGGAYGDNSVGTATLNSLSSGHQYLLQFWVNDTRTTEAGAPKPSRVPAATPKP